MRYVYDDGDVVTVKPPRELTDEAVTTVLRALEDRLAEGSPYVIVFDMSEAGTPNAVQRQMLATHIRKNKASIGRSVRALAMVAPSSLVRGVLTAIFWLESPPVPHKVFSTVDEANAWVRATVASKVPS